MIGNWNDFAVIVAPKKKLDQVIDICRNIDLTTKMFLFVPNILCSSNGSTRIRYTSQLMGRKSDLRF